MSLPSETDGLFNISCIFLDILIVLTNLGTPLWSLPREWSPSAMVVVRLSRPCNFTNQVEAPLMLHCPRILLLCQDSLGNIYLLTWIPFTGELQKLGRWNSQRFTSWDHIFIDRFKTFAGRALHVSSDFDDMPLLKNTEGLLHQGFFNLFSYN